MSDAPPPLRVIEADGSTAPFEPEKIQHALFAAAESLGDADAFLVRELTDAVVHFLNADAAASPPTVAELRDTVEKVVRELGHPELARAYREHSAHEPPRPAAKASAQPSAAVDWLTPQSSFLEIQRRAAGERLRSESLQAVWPREFGAAMAAGLLHLGSLETPLELAGAVLPLHDGEVAILEAVLAAREYAGARAICCGFPELYDKRRPLFVATVEVIARD